MHPFMIRGEPPKIPVSAPEPYPEITTHGPNPRLVRLLMQDICYAKGELTAVHQYLYQQWMLEASRPDVAEVFLRIGQVEMRHLELLGRLVRRLGGDPRFCCPQQQGCAYWGASQVSYGQGLRRMLQANITGERDAADLYESQARFVKEENVAAVLARLALDEKLHLQIMRDYLAGL